MSRLICMVPRGRAVAGVIRATGDIGGLLCTDLRQLHRAGRSFYTGRMIYAAGTFDIRAPDFAPFFPHLVIVL